MQCACGRTHFWNSTTSMYADTLPNDLVAIIHNIITRKFIINYLTAWSGLTCSSCSGNRALLISGQFVLQVLVPKKSEGPVLFEIAIMSCIF